ncbi:MAG: phospho-N-acetylmuramoyl-pentapeptide-transferase [Kiritimatiellae bacterium]|nr:phospho-N-acetylmuramoyl-pentapeptide-transferase [Kiritimatiellia bacterium]MDW8458220.1 phospho-N-acetylmuramoyl-pentapeptide-transferase [Verrucomicrobiota bacterium]
MLFFLHELTEWWTPLRLFRYITFRALMGAGTAFILSLIFGPLIIRWLQRLKFGQYVRDDAVLAHQRRRKSGTPTMGGVLIIAAVVLSTVLWADVRNGYVWFALATMLAMGAVGFWDDYLKISRKNARGLPGRTKLALEIAWSLAVVAALYLWEPSRTHVAKLMLPFLKEPVIAEMAVPATALFLTLVLVGSANAVNLTDGLDGLAIGCTNAAAAAYLALAYVAGNVLAANYLLVPYVPGSGELAVFCGCLLGAGLGFLWFNCHPARVFMGDTGSLALGGAIGMVAVAIKQELLLVIVGGVFVIEALSVIIQVASFKLTGRRVFRVAPIHHHFEQIEKERAAAEGRDVEVVETMVTTRFWILGILFAMIGLATLKIR